MNYYNKTQEKYQKTTKPKFKYKHHKKFYKSSTPFYSQEKEIEIEPKKSSEIKEELQKKEIKEIPSNNHVDKEDKEDLILSSNISQIKSPEEKRQYSFEYLQLFENMEKSKETDLLPGEVLDHINQIKDNLRSMKMNNLLKINTLINNSGNNCNSSKSSCSSFSTKMSLETWGRQDYTKETEEAENNKKIFEEYGKKDVIKKELRELLNIMTKDNFEEIKIKILEIIKDKTENQDKFLDIIFIKALLEKSYVTIYSQLCKELNKALPQKIKKKSSNNNNSNNNSTKKKREKYSTIFREKLLDKCKNVLKFEENKCIEEFIKEENEHEKNVKIKKIILGDALFICELINIKLLSRKAGCDCIDYLFKKYKECKNQKLQLINIEAIIIFLDKLGSLMHKEKEPGKEKRIKENLYIKEKIKETFEKLEKIKDEEIIPGHIKYLIINLIKKKENDYKQSEFEKYITAKSKKDLEDKEELNKEKTEKEEIKEIKEITQEEINKLIENDLMGYKDMVESEGNSENYLWEITTDLYDLKLKGFDSILEGYFICSGDFIEKKGNLIHAKNYIKELVEYYHEKMEKKEKDDLLNKFVDLFELVKDHSFETPDIYVLYEYVLEIFIKNEVFKIKDFENLFIAKENYKDDKNTICKIIKNVFDNISKDVFEKEFKELKFLNKQIHL